jgi:hypothetical protein
MARILRTYRTTAFTEDTSPIGPAADSYGGDY